MVALDSLSVFEFLYVLKKKKIDGFAILFRLFAQTFFMTTYFFAFKMNETGLFGHTKLSRAFQSRNP